jgi:hypothetical protein
MTWQVLVRLVRNMQWRVLAPGEVAPLRSLYIVWRGCVLYGWRVLVSGMSWGVRCAPHACTRTCPARLARTCCRQWHAHACDGQHRHSNEPPPDRICCVRLVAVCS